MTTFADLSHHQSTVDLSLYAQSHDRIALKATEGTTFIDPEFASRWREAGQLGLARTAYHFARNANSGSLEFDHFWRVVQSVGGLTSRDTLCLDSEDTTAPARAVAHASEFTARAVIVGGVSDGMVYTGRWYAQPFGLTASCVQPGWRRLWLSDYTAAHPDDTMPLPDGWTRDQVCARQYTSTATVAGVADPCDYSRVLYEWLPTTDEGYDMATLDEVLAELRQIDDRLSDLYRVGFKSSTVSGTEDPTHELYSVRGTNERLQKVIDLLTKMTT